MRTIVQAPTSNLKKSIKYYSDLQFEILTSDGKTYVSDGQIIIEINQTRTARAGVKLIRTSWNEMADRLRKITSVLDTEEGFIVNDPSGVWIYLIEGKEASIPALSSSDPSKLGNCGGVCIESLDFDRSLAIWETLGFKLSSGMASQGWVCLKNDNNFSVSIMKANMCPHLFINPSLTYFNGDKNLELIEEIRKSNIPILEEISSFNEQGIVDNIILQDPGGLGCFLFSD